MPDLRKRGRKPPETETITMDYQYTKPTSQNDAAVANTHHNPSSPRRTRGRARRTLTEDENNSGNGNNSNSNIGHLASLERSGHGDANEITILPSRWDSVAVKAVASMDAVVKVFCVHTEPNFSLAWQRKRQYSSSSSGFIVGGRRVLTNAHSVEHHTQVKLKKRGSDTKYLATVLSIGTECDIGKQKCLNMVLQNFYIGLFCWFPG